MISATYLGNYNQMFITPLKYQTEGEKITQCALDARHRIEKETRPMSAPFSPRSEGDFFCTGEEERPKNYYASPFASSPAAPSLE